MWEKYDPEEGARCQGQKDCDKVGEKYDPEERARRQGQKNRAGVREKYDPEEGSAVPDQKKKENLLTFQKQMTIIINNT